MQETNQPSWDCKSDPSQSLTCQVTPSGFRSGIWIGSCIFPTVPLMDIKHDEGFVTKHDGNSLLLYSRLGVMYRGIPLMLAFLGELRTSVEMPNGSAACVNNRQKREGSSDIHEKKKENEDELKSDLII